MKIKKLLTTLLSTVLIISSVIPAYAYNIDENGNSIEMVEYQNNKDEDYTNTSQVFAELSSIYKVTLPKTVVLSGTNKNASYFVKVEGDIAGYEKINVVPDDSFILYSAGKDSQKATINQDKTTWHVSDFDTDANGKVEAKDITAGKWIGTFNFNINLESFLNIPENVKLVDLGQLQSVEAWNSSNSKVVSFDKGNQKDLFVTFEDKNVTNDLLITSSNEDVIKVEEDNTLLAQNIGTSLITMKLDTGKKVKSQSFLAAVTDETFKDCLHLDTQNVYSEKMATCTEDGNLTISTVCNDCGQIIEEQEMLGMSATGHVYLLGSRKDLVYPSCTQPGSYTAITGCSVCGYGYEEIPNQYIPPLGHEFKNGFCTVCGEKALEYAITANIGKNIFTKFSDVVNILSLNDLNNEFRIEFPDVMLIGGAAQIPDERSVLYAAKEGDKIYINPYYEISTFFYTSENSGFMSKDEQGYLNIYNNKRKITRTNNQKLYFMMPSENIDLNIYLDSSNNLHIDGIYIYLEGTTCNHEYKITNLEANCSVPGFEELYCTRCGERNISYTIMEGSDCINYDFVNTTYSIILAPDRGHNFINNICIYCNYRKEN